MVCKKNNLKIYFSTIIIAIVALFAASLFSFGINTLNEKANAAAGANVYVFHMGNTCWTGESIVTKRLTSIKQVDAEGNTVYQYAFSPNDQPNNIVKPYVFKGWATVENGTVKWDDKFILLHPPSNQTSTNTSHYYAVWEKSPYKSTIKLVNNPAGLNENVYRYLDDSCQIVIKYTDIDNDGENLYGGNKNIEFYSYEYIESTAEEVIYDDPTRKSISFYKSDLGWDISQSATGSSTWYLPRRMFVTDNGSVLYNEGLPVLRQFVAWEELKLSLKYKHSNGQTYTVRIGSVQIPKRDDSFKNNYNDWLDYYNKKTQIITENGSTIYGNINIFDWKFACGFDMAEESESLDDSYNVLDFFKSTAKWEYNYSTNTLYFSCECADQKTIDSVFKKAYVTFEQPQNKTTGNNVGAYWGEMNSNGLFIPSKTSTGTAQQLNFTVYDGTPYTYSYSTNCFTFSVCKKKDGVVQNVEQKIYMQLQDGYTYTKSDYTITASGVKTVLDKNVSGSLTGENTVSLSYALEYYDLSVGYTVENSSQNANASMLSTKYSPNGTGGGSYQDVTYEFSYTTNSFSVEGFDLPTSEEELKTIFGDDYNNLLGKTTGAQKRVFNGWLLDVTALERLGYEYVGTVGNVVTWENGSYWVKFNVGNRITTLNGSRSIYLSLTKVSGYGDFVFGDICWGNNEKGFAEKSFVLPIVPNWSSEYNVQVQNPIEQRMDANNEAVITAGVIKGKSSSNFTVENKVDFVVNSSTPIEFVYTDGSAFVALNQAFYSSLYDYEGKYGLYKYGYQISGYQITFMYNGTTFYACYCSAKNANGIDMGAAWYPVCLVGNEYKIKMYDALGNATIYTPVLPQSNGKKRPVSTVDMLKTTNLWKLIANFSTWTQGDFILQNTTFVITPEWTAATIQLSEATGNDFANLNKLDYATVTYDKEYIIDRGNCATTGKTIVYYVTNSGSIVAADYTKSMFAREKVVWDYLNITDYIYVLNGDYYNLTLRKVEIDNLYMVKLDSSVYDLDLDESSDYVLSDESISSSISTVIDSTYNAAYRTIWAYYTVAYQKGICVEAYTMNLKYTVANYENGINVNSDNIEQARSKFKLRYLLEAKNSSGQTTNRYIIVANNHPIGNLTFSKPYYINVATMFNGVNGAYAFTTSKYNSTFVPHKDFLTTDINGPRLKTEYIKSMSQYTWTIDMDSKNIGQTPTLYPLFYREAYSLNLDYYYKVGDYLYNGFVGLLDVAVVDNAADNAYSGGNGRYLVYYNNATNNTKIYKYSNNAVSTDYNAAELSKWANVLTEDFVVGSITIYRGCSVSVNVLDQSKILDLNLTNNFYDAMIGYRFAKELDAKVEQTVSQTLNDVAYTVDFNTNTGVEESTKLSGLFDAPVDLVAGDSITLYFMFEPINYNTTIALTDQNAGKIHIARPGSSLIITEKPQRLSNLQRGSTASIFYYAYAGYGLQQKDFTIDGNLIESLDMYGNSIVRTTDEELQTYKLNLSGAWLRIYLYKNGTYSVDASQTLGQIDINIDYLEFDVYARIYDKYASEIETKTITTGWQITAPNIDWQLPVSALETYNGQTIYAYYRSANQSYYALLNSWANQPRTQPSSRDLFGKTYDFLLETAPINSYTITTDNLFNMVLTTAGIIVPTSNRTFYFDLEVAEMYKLSLSILVGVNDTNCSTRVLTIANSENNVVTLKADDGYIQSNDLPYIYTYLGLENTLAATYDDKYYTGVSFSALDLPASETSSAYSITSPLLANCNKIVYANFVPVQLPVDLTINYNGTKVVQNPTASAEDQALIAQYFTAWQMKTISGEMNNVKNSTETGKVVAFDTINFNYTLKEVYNLTISINGSSSRLVYDAQTGSYNAVVATSDYLQNKVQIVVDVVDKKQGQITLEIGKDNSNEASFYTTDDTIMYAFADLWINGINYGKSGAFMTGYSLKIKLNTIAAGYEFVGVKKDQGSINTNYTLSGNEIVITDGKLPDGMFEDDFVTSISGKYYAVFKKTLFKTELVLNNLPEALKNNYGYSVGGRTAVWRDGHLAVSKGSSVGDTLTLFRNSDLPYEKFVRYYYIDKSGKQQTISNSKLAISSDVFANIKDTNADGTKLLKLYVETSLKYNLTFVVEETSLQFLNQIEVNGTTLSSVTNTFATNYFEAGTVVSYTITSLLPDKYTIVVSGDATSTGDSISGEIALSSNRSINIKITKNSYGLTVEEKLFADIVQLNNNVPETLTGNDVINPNINGNKVDYVYNSNTTYVDVLSTSGEGENKKQLTSITFEDENLTFVLTLDLTSQNFISNIDAKTASGVAIESSSIKLTQDKSNQNLFKLSLTISGKTYTYTFEKTNTGAIQFGFVGLSNAKLTLTYTIFKLIKIS